MLYFGTGMLYTHKNKEYMLNLLATNPYEKAHNKDSSPIDATK